MTKSRAKTHTYAQTFGKGGSLRDRRRERGDRPQAARGHQAGRPLQQPGDDDPPANIPQLQTQKISFR
jgi:hypothetical protein